MNADTLERVRFATPGAIATVASLPGALFLNLSAAQQETAIKVVIPLVALVFGVAYSALGLREWAWRREKNLYVVQQIRQNISSLIPADLNVTPGEGIRLVDEIWNELSGVFWAAVNDNADIEKQKSFFFNNGAFYTGAIDACQISLLFAVAYFAVWAWGWGAVHVLFSCACLAIAWVSYAVMRYRRKIHLKLSIQQLKDLSADHADSIGEKFRAIIMRWRNEERTRSQQSDLGRNL